MVNNGFSSANGSAKLSAVPPAGIGIGSLFHAGIVPSALPARTAPIGVNSVSLMPNLASSSAVNFAIAIPGNNAADSTMPMVFLVLNVKNFILSPLTLLNYFKSAIFRMSN